MRLVYSDEAIADVDRLRAVVAEKEPSAAERVGLELVQRLDNLRLFPQMGRHVALAPDPNSVRDAVFGNSIVRYSVHAQTLVVLRVWRHFENWE